MIAYHVQRTTHAKSPIHGGFRGPTLPQPRPHLCTMISKIPCHSSNSAAPQSALNGEEEEELKPQNKPTFHQLIVNLPTTL